MNCKGTKRNGEPCQKGALKGSEYCFGHDPRRSKERAKIARKGGEGRGKPPIVIAVPSGERLSHDDLLRITGQGIRELLSGVLDPKAGSALSSLVGRMQKLIKEVPPEPLEGLSDEELKDRALAMLKEEQ